ncbi:hypothetical protein NB646_06555 [Oxalobacter aliiformigenes]|uniref:Uncharacterized protein n=1 Tax=Oxalobacter aliiformigenes TaxID=2946593 RepID=A0A9E9LAG2_9BURK|nr:hypothetical protein [Oxalobacter aliiformigenes]WAV90528.1 hypothetical protein NB646_06555 [Oxalobacter aliiformigenes]
MNRFFIARYIEQDGAIWRACGSEKQFLPARKAVTGVPVRVSDERLFYASGYIDDAECFVSRYPEKV